jgi:hypothetical protein
VLHLCVVHLEHAVILCSIFILDVHGVRTTTGVAGELYVAVSARCAVNGTEEVHRASQRVRFVSASARRNALVTGIKRQVFCRNVLCAVWSIFHPCANAVCT